MAEERWRKRRETANDGKAMIVWSKLGYEICINVNHGHSVRQGVPDARGHYWWYEVTLGMEVVGEAPSLPAAKRLAREHHEKEAA